MDTLADKINKALAEGANIYANTYASTMRFTKRHAGMLFMAANGRDVVYRYGAKSITFLAGSTAWRY